MDLPSPLRKFVNHVRFMRNVMDADSEVKRLKNLPSTGISREALDLRNTGIVIVNDAMSPEACDRNREKIEAFAKKFTTSTTLPSGTFVGFRTEVSNDNADKGMIDIAGVDLELKDLEYREQIPMIEKIITEATGKQAHFQRLNTYINVGVTGTRDYHVDNFHSVFKAFIYLTDVPDDSYGPYSFVKNTHGYSLAKYLNIYRNAVTPKNRTSDMPRFYRKEDVVNCYGRKGNLVISDQGGIHRGVSQEPGKKRVALVYNFRLEGDPMIGRMM